LDRLRVWSRSLGSIRSTPASTVRDQRIASHKAALSLRENPCGLAELLRLATRDVPGRRLGMRTSPLFFETHCKSPSPDGSRTSLFLFVVALLPDVAIPTFATVQRTGSCMAWQRLTTWPRRRTCHERSGGMDSCNREHFEFVNDSARRQGKADYTP